MRRFTGLLLAAAVVLACAGCQGVRGGRELVRAEASVPLAEELAASSPQRRTLPWSDLSVDAAARYSLNDATAADVSTGLRLALARLAARDRAIREVAARVAELPAADAPPGETGQLTVLRFSQRRPAVSLAVNSELSQSLEEKVVQEPGGEGAVFVRLVLKPLAETVLLHGGGFVPEDAAVQESGPRARASADAARLAREELLKKVLAKKFDGGLAVKDWIDADPRNRAAFTEAWNAVRTVRGEPSRRAGESVWQTELEFDLGAFRTAQKETTARRTRLEEGSGKVAPDKPIQSERSGK